MPVPSLPFQIEYQLGDEEARKLYEMQFGDPYQGWRTSFWCSNLLWFGALVLGIYCAVAANLMLPASCFAVGAVYFLINARKTERRTQQSLANQKKLRGKRGPIVLEVNERGFVERDFGVESFCPWSSMVNCCLHEEVLFVALANSLWAIVPAHAFPGDPKALSGLHQLLLDHGVTDRKRTS